MSRDAAAGSEPQSRLERRVVAAEALLPRGTSVSPIDVLAAIGWLPPGLVDGWRRGAGAADPAAGARAAGRAFDEDAVTLAVVASVWHQDTNYDELLMAGAPCAIAREQVRPDIGRVLAAWQHP